MTSFRTPPKRVLGGEYDDELRAFFDNAPKDRPVYWSYFHEPETAVMEGEFRIGLLGRVSSRSEDCSYHVPTEPLSDRHLDRLDAELNVQTELARLLPWEALHIGLGLGHL